MGVWLLLFDIGVSLVSVCVSIVYIVLQYREYCDARTQLLRECAEAVVCEAFQRFMQPTIALRFECLTRQPMHHDPLFSGNHHIVHAVDTHINLSSNLQMTAQDMDEMVHTAEVIWQDEGYQPRCPSAELRHALLVCASHRLHGLHVEQLLQDATTFAHAVRMASFLESTEGDDAQTAVNPAQ